MKHVIQYLLILMLFTVPLVFSHATTEVYGLVKVAALELFALALLALWLIQTVQGKTLNNNAVQGLALNSVMLFFIIACVSLVNAVNVYAGIEALYLLAAYIAVFFVILNSVRGAKDTRQLITAIIFAGVAACLWSIYQNKGMNFSAIRFSYASTFGNPIFFSQYLTAVIPLSCAMAIRQFHKTDNARFVKLGLYLVAIALSIALLIAARSRGAYMGLLVACLYCYIVAAVLSSEKVKKIMLGIAVSGIVLTIVAAAALWPKLEARFEGRHLQNMMRVHVWQSSANIIKARPFLGVGAGNFEYAYPLYRTEEEKEVTPKGVKYTRAHNQILQIWSQVGVFGLLAFLAIIYLTLFSLPKASSYREGFMTIGIKAALIALLVQSLFNPMLEIPTSGLLFWALLGMLVSCRNRGYLSAPCYSTNNILRAKSKRITAGTLCVASLILMPANILKPLISDYYLEKAQVKEAAHELSDALAYLEKSLRAYPHNWKALFLSGKLHQSMSSYASAVKYYKKAARYHPNYPLIWNNLGTASMQANMIEGAIAAFRRTIEIDEEYIGAHYNLGIAYGRHGQAHMREQQLEKVDELDPTFLGNMYLESGIFDDAAIEFHKAIRRDPGNIEANFKLAQVWHRRDETTKAIRRYQKTVELAPRHVEAHMALARLYKGKGDMEAAIDSLENALEAIPHKKEDLAKAISLYSDMGIYAQVLEKYDAIEELDKVKLEAYRYLAEIYSSKGQVKKAISSYERLTEELPRDASMWKELADVYERQGMYKEAKDAYAKVIWVDPQQRDVLEGKLLLLNKFAAHHALARMYESQSMHARAVAEYKKVLAFEPENIFTMRKLAQTYIASAVIASEQSERSNLFSQAEEILTKIFEIAGADDVETYLLMGELFSKTERFSEAEINFTRAIEAAPYDSRGVLSLAGIYRRQNKLTEAEVVYEKALESSSEDVELHINLAILMEEKGDMDRAIQEYKEVLRIEPDNKEAQIRLDACSRSGLELNL